MEKREERVTSRYFAAQIPSGEKSLGKYSRKMLTVAQDNLVWGWIIAPIKDLKAEVAIVGVQRPPPPIFRDGIQRKATAPTEQPTL